eukprot:3843-Heterococcus_DN1.PRE.1
MASKAQPKLHYCTHYTVVLCADVSLLERYLRVQRLCNNAGTAGGGANGGTPHTPSLVPPTPLQLRSRALANYDHTAGTMLPSVKQQQQQQHNDSDSDSGDTKQKLLQQSSEADSTSTVAAGADDHSTTADTTDTTAAGDRTTSAGATAGATAVTTADATAGTTTADATAVDTEHSQQQSQQQQQQERADASAGDHFEHSELNRDEHQQHQQQQQAQQDTESVADTASSYTAAGSYNSHITAVGLGPLALAAVGVSSPEEQDCIRSHKSGTNSCALRIYPAVPMLLSALLLELYSNCNVRSTSAQAYVAVIATAVAATLCVLLLLCDYRRHVVWMCPTGCAMPG